MLTIQDYNNSIYQDIDMVRGDTLLFNIELQGLEGAEPTITFSCAENYNDEALFTADTSDGITREEYDEDTDTALYSVRIAPEKTRGLELARYYYDLQLDDGVDVITLMRGRLELLYEVTKGV